MIRLLSVFSFLLLLSAGSATAIAASDSTGAAAESFGAFKHSDFSAPAPYHISWKVDAPIIGAGMAWTFYAFTKVYSKPSSDSADVAKLDKNNLWFIDRWAAGKHSKSADRTSNIPFYGCIPYPFLLALDPAIRKDAFTVGVLYLEAMAITGTIYTGTNYFVDRYRPEVYAADVPVNEKLSGNGRNAFPAGHPALVSTATFFAASVFDQYHPHSSWKWAFYGVAAAATGATIYLRHIAGKHFPSDLFVGTAVGVCSGMLVPRLHRYKPNQRGTGLRISPYSEYGQGGGFSAVYRF